MTPDFGSPPSDPGSRIPVLGPRTSDLRPLPSDLGLRFALRAETALEDFGDRSLVLLCDSLQLREINAQAQKILALLDGERTVQDIALRLASSCGVPASDLLETVAKALLQMEEQGIVRRRVVWSRERSQPMSTTKYLMNPEVSFRQEDEDGGILFNADTDAVEVINPVAVAIWTFLAAPRMQEEVVEHLCAVCADVPREQVGKDVEDFLASLLKKGFIGIVESNR